MIPRGALGGAGAIKCGTMYIAAQFMIISWSVACLFRSRRACTRCCAHTPATARAAHVVEGRVSAAVSTHSHPCMCTRLRVGTNTASSQAAHLRAACAGRERGQAAGAGGAVVRDRVGGADAARARPAREREPRGAGRGRARRGAHWGAAGLHAAAPRPDRRAHGHLCATHCGDSGSKTRAHTQAQMSVLHAQPKSTYACSVLTAESPARTYTAYCLSQRGLRGRVPTQHAHEH
mgnify:CR=1 FL=1